MVSTVNSLNIVNWDVTRPNMTDDVLDFFRIGQRASKGHKCGHSNLDTKGEVS